MIFCIFFLVLEVSARYLIDAEILRLENSLEKHSKARSLLASNQKPSDLSVLSLEQTPEEWVLSKLIPRSKITFSKPVSNVQFLTLKPIGQYRDLVNSLNIAYITSCLDGTIQILESSGEVILTYNLTYPGTFLATTAHYDEIKFATISPNFYLEIYEFHMDKLKKNETDSGKLNFHITKESFDVLHTNRPSSILYYVKTGKKYWIIGDEEGVIHVHLMNGTLYKQINTNLGSITSLDRFGQNLVFSTNNSVGLLSPVSFEISQICLDLNTVKDICIDTFSSSSYVYALTSESLVVLDTKYQQANDNYCKGNFISSRWSLEDFWWSQ